MLTSPLISNSAYIPHTYDRALIAEEKKVIDSYDKLNGSKPPSYIGPDLVKVET